ncbi:MAG: RDD family protein [Erythrobacter sp.]|uniref:RDD family protein n=1 Tax=Erythrobacter sp. TaxID=1042 RepID=UPI0032EE7C84
MDYAGFWIRVLAYLIDAVILGLISAALALLSGGAVIDLEAQQSLGITDFLGLIVGLAYFIGFEGSQMQATPGKKVLGLIVTDMQGRRISYPRAAGRYFGKILSGFILLIGYIMVAFTEKKQGLHDLLASTLVVKGQPGMVGYDPSVFE